MIRLSKLADYGIVMMTHLARAQALAGPTAEGVPVGAGAPGQASAQMIASDTSIPQPMASKILKLLGRADLLRSQRGAHGGYELARPASQISVAEVIEALEGPIALTQCIDESDGDCCIETLCPARSNWQRINGAIRDALDGISIGEMSRAIPEAFMLAEPAAPATKISEEV